MTELITMHSYLPHKGGIYVGDDREIRFPTRLFKDENERIRRRYNGRIRI